MDIIRSLLRAVTPLPDGDFSDRLSYCYSTTILVVLSAFISGWSFVGAPIQCWFPAYYKGWWIEYALDYCYVQNTYFVPFTKVQSNSYWEIAEHIVPIPKNITERENQLIVTEATKPYLRMFLTLGYYQWVPFILAFQAVIFYLPVVLWRSAYSTTGMKVEAICETCRTKSNLIVEERTKNMDKVASFLASERKIDDSFGGWKSSLGSGRILITVYLLVKLIYLLNAIFQFFLIKYMLGVGTFWWGIQVFSDLMQGTEWPETGNFPRITLCDFVVRVMANVHRHTVQCVLMINMFNEKIFVFLWFWLLLVAIASFASFVYWMVLSLSNRSGQKMIANFIEKIDPSVKDDKRYKALVDEFVVQILRPDGLFLLRLIRMNSGDIVTCELISILWRDFIKNRINPPPYLSPFLAKNSPSSDVVSQF